MYLGYLITFDLTRWWSISHTIYRIGTIAWLIFDFCSDGHRMRITFCRVFSNFHFASDFLSTHYSSHDEYKPGCITLLPYKTFKFGNILWGCVLHKKWTGHIFTSQGIYLKSLYSFTLHLFQILSGPYGNAYKVLFCQFSKINIFDERSDVYKKDYLATSLDTQKSFRILRIWFASISIILYKKGGYWAQLRIDNIKLYGNLLLPSVFQIRSF